MKKTFWLYYGNILVDAVRCLADATDWEVRSYALELHHKCPTISHLWPLHGTAVGMMISQARVERV